MCQADTIQDHTAPFTIRETQLLSIDKDCVLDEIETFQFVRNWQFTSYSGQPTQKDTSQRLQKALKVQSQCDSILLIKDPKMIAQIAIDCLQLCALCFRSLQHEIHKESSEGLIFTCPCSRDNLLSFLLCC
jgi:hypothetical protein